MTAAWSRSAEAVVAARSMAIMLSRATPPTQPFKTNGTTINCCGTALAGRSVTALVLTFKDRRVQQVQVGPTVKTACQVLMVPLVQTGRTALQVPIVPMALMVRTVLLVRQVLMVPLVQTARTVRQVPMVPMAPMARLVQTARLALMVRTVLQVQTVKTWTQVHTCR